MAETRQHDKPFTMRLSGLKLTQQPAKYEPNPSLWESRAFATVEVFHSAGFSRIPYRIQSLVGTLPDLFMKIGTVQERIIPPEVYD